MNVSESEVYAFAESHTDEILAVMESSICDVNSPGFCLACGSEVMGCEPDMENGPCPCCGARAVWGAEELMFYAFA